MLIQFRDYLTFDFIYLWTTLGVLPFWLMLIFIPNSKITQIFVNSVILPLILAIAYGFTIYQAILLEEAFLDIFKLYSSLDDLYTVLATESFLLFFWLHFTAFNLFLGSWVSRDGIKFNVSKKILFISLILIYFTGPLGLVFYWFIRVFYSKKLGFHD
tara:strand:- start:756 stop:1229 length:474 start_codon:yes stop_codon:yes gene_type:complete